MDESLEAVERESARLRECIEGEGLAADEADSYRDSLASVKEELRCSFAGEADAREVADLKRSLASFTGELADAERHYAEFVAGQEAACHALIAQAERALRAIKALRETTAKEDALPAGARVTMTKHKVWPDEPHLSNAWCPVTGDYAKVAIGTIGTVIGPAPGAFPRSVVIAFDGVPHTVIVPRAKVEVPAHLVAGSLPSHA
jgi:hypothetical protein